MAMTTNLLQSLIPITQFNRGWASKIFDRLQAKKQLAMLKNNQPSVIILPPEGYERLTGIEENYLFLMEANERLKKNEGKNSIPSANVFSNLGITERGLSKTGDIDIG